MVGASEPAVCWNCARLSLDTETCGWCGVWLADLDPDKVPPAARGWLALARRWGIPDDGDRSDAITRATRAELEEMLGALQDDSVWAEVDSWLVGPEADAVVPSREYVAITCLTMAADHARLQLGRLVQSSPTGVGRELPDRPPAQDLPIPGGQEPWPTELLNALRLGRRLVAEVPAAPGRRAFIDITPTRDDRDAQAEREGWQRSDRDRAFRVEHWDYDEQQIGGWDYDIGAQRVHAQVAADETALLGLIAAWGLRPTDFTHPWKTDDPR